MVAYADDQQVRLAVARDPQKPIGSAATLTPDQVQLAIDDAQAEVDGRLRSRYVVPFTAPVPDLVVSITIDIAAYLVSLTFYQEKDMKDTDPAVRRYKRACCLLGDIAAGYVVLDADDTDSSSPSTAVVGTPIDPHGDGFLTCEFVPRHGGCW